MSGETPNQSMTSLAQCLPAPSGYSRNDSNFKIDCLSPKPSADWSLGSRWHRAFLSLWQTLLSTLPQWVGALPRCSLTLVPHPCILTSQTEGPIPHCDTSSQVCSIQHKTRGRRKPVISPLVEIHKKYFWCCHSYNKQQASPRERKTWGKLLLFVHWAGQKDCPSSTFPKCQSRHSAR